MDNWFKVIVPGYPEYRVSFDGVVEYLDSQWGWTPSPSKLVAAAFKAGQKSMEMPDLPPVEPPRDMRVIVAIPSGEEVELEDVESWDYDEGVLDVTGHEHPYLATFAPGCWESIIRIPIGE